MRHLSQEEMLDRYYASGGAAAERHLDECEECAAAYAAVESDLNLLRPMEVPERGEDYGEQVWARVLAALPPRPVKAAPRVEWWRGWGRVPIYAAACAVLVAGAFWGGMAWEHELHLRRVADRGKLQHQPQPQQAPKVVVVVLGDHLDRSERLLVELKHADADDMDQAKPLRDEARNLLAANHEFREDADKSGDSQLAQALDHLDKLLNEIANQPGGLNGDAIVRLQNEMKADGLLFEVRVLRAKNPHRDAAVHVLARGGTA